MFFLFTGFFSSSSLMSSVQSCSGKKTRQAGLQAGCTEPVSYVWEAVNATLKSISGLESCSRALMKSWTTPSRSNLALILQKITRFRCSIKHLPKIKAYDCYVYIIIFIYKTIHNQLHSLGKEQFKNYLQNRWSTKCVLYQEMRWKQILNILVHTI